MGMIACREGARLPKKAHLSDAGYDVYLPADVTLEPGERKKIASGIKLIMPNGCRAETKIRSSNWLAGLQAEGVIDAGYRGELYYMIENRNKHSVQLDKHTRPAQLVFSVVPEIEITLEENILDEPTDQTSSRGESGFGSSGS